MPATAVPFTGLFDAIELQTYWLGPDDDPDTLLIRLPHQDYDAEIIARPKTGISAEQAMLQGNLALLIGSGFVATQNGLQPVGLLQSEGRTLSAVQSHGYTRILGLSEKGPGVIHRQNYETNIFHSALQAGPGIIEKGLLDISERDLQRPAYFRSFVGLCEKEWLLGISLKPAHLRTLGEQLMTFIAAQEMACDEVVNLAGDRQAVLMVRDPEDNLIYHGDPHTYKVSLIGFQMRP
ncbi:MAG: hypothetical protein AAF993_20700 [Pseudomonadota bacterium]